MATIITTKAKITQVKPGLWKTEENLLFIDNEDNLIYVPKNFLTDLITFFSCDFADVRAAIIHDVGCKYHELIYINTDLDTLKEKGYLISRGKNLICLDIPTKYLTIKKVSFLKINNIFKQALKSCNEKFFKRNIMYFAVHLNLGWLTYPFKRNKINLNDFYENEW